MPIRHFLFIAIAVSLSAFQAEGKNYIKAPTKKAVEKQPETPKFNINLTHKEACEIAKRYWTCICSGCEKMDKGVSSEYPEDLVCPMSHRNCIGRNPEAERESSDEEVARIEKAIELCPIEEAREGKGHCG